VEAWTSGGSASSTRWGAGRHRAECPPCPVSLWGTRRRAAESRATSRMVILQACGARRLSASRPAGGAVIYGASDFHITARRYAWETQRDLPASRAVPEVLDHWWWTSPIPRGRRAVDGRFVVRDDGRVRDDRARRLRSSGAIRETRSPLPRANDVLADPGVAAHACPQGSEVPVKRILMGAPAARSREAALPRQPRARSSTSVEARPPARARAAGRRLCRGALRPVTQAGPGATPACPPAKEPSERPTISFMIFFRAAVYRVTRAVRVAARSGYSST